MIIPTRKNNAGKQFYSVHCRNCGSLNPSHARRSAFSDADFYLCPGCDQYFHLDIPEGYICKIDLYAAPGGWCGYQMCKMTVEDMLHLENARHILALGLQSISVQRDRSHANLLVVE